MKGIKLFVLFFLVMGLFEVTLFSSITSRIEGVVRDFDTGAVIIGAEVRLFRVNSIGGRNPKITTYNDGRFRFDDLRQGEYCISVFKEGYELYGPFTRQELKEEDERNVHPYPPSYFKLIKTSVKDRIYLKEGEIKHFKISLRKEAIVEVFFTKKTEKGETPLVPTDKSGKVNLKRRLYGAIIVLIESENYGSDNETFLEPSIVEPGKLTFKNLSGEQKVKVASLAYNYPLSVHEVYLKSGETTTIHHSIDFISGMVVHGFIEPKNPDKLFYIKCVTLDSSNYLIKGIIEENREFWLKGMEEGKCKLTIEVIKRSDNRWKVIKDVIVLDLKKNERTELDLQY
jgi:hypothetical protein